MSILNTLMGPAMGAGLADTLTGGAISTASTPPPDPKATRKAAISEFTSDLMFTLAQSFGAGNQKGAGVAAALAGPGQRRTLVQQAEDERVKLTQESERRDLENRKLRKELITAQKSITSRQVTEDDGSVWEETIDRFNPSQVLHRYQVKPPAKPEEPELIGVEEPTSDGGTQTTLQPKVPGMVTKTTPAPKSDATPELIATLKANPEQYDNLPPTLKAEVMPALFKQGFKFPKKTQQMLGELTQPQFQAMVRLQTSVRSDPEYLDMVDIDSGMKGVEVGLRQDNGFGDITAINAFQKMVDPGATVREGDVALMQSASAFMDKVLSDFPIERLRSGAKLPPATRQAMLTTAKQLYEIRANNYNDRSGRMFKAQAAAAGVPFDLIGRDFIVEGAKGVSTGLENVSTDELLKRLK